MPHHFEHDPLSAKLKALDAQVVHEDGALPKRQSFVWGIVGPRGTGKTTLALNVLMHGFKKHFNRIFLVSKTARSDMQSKAELAHLYEELDEHGQVYDTLNESCVEEIIENIQQFNEDWKNKKTKKKRPPQHLIIIDDQISNLPRNRSSIVSDIVVNGRHLKTSVWFTSQYYMAIPPLWRNNLQVLSLFASPNKKEQEKFEAEIAVPEDELEAAFDIATREPNSFLTINMQRRPYRLFKRFDRIIFS